jgi:mannitol-specific phosphotransferase system IIBC component
VLKWFHPRDEVNHNNQGVITVETTPDLSETVENNEPVLYSSRMLTLITTLLSVFSWVVLVAFIADAVAQAVNVQITLTQQSLSLAEVLRQPSAVSFLITNISTPLFTGIGLFLVMQGGALGLNVLREMDLMNRNAL